MKAQLLASSDCSVDLVLDQLYSPYFEGSNRVDAKFLVTTNGVDWLDWIEGGIG